MVGISSGIEYPTVGFLSVVSLSWYNVLLLHMTFHLSLAKFSRFPNRLSRQANWARNWNGKYCILYFSTKLKKSYIIHYNYIITFIMYFCHHENMLLCIFHHVMQITHFHIGVQRCDTVSSVHWICLPAQPVHKS